MTAEDTATSFVMFNYAVNCSCYLTSMMDECERNTDNNTDRVELKSTEKQVRTQNFSLGVG